ncbi:MAG TPA: T9SS type A sorting domain-containing protein [Bacteroidia bacterium]|jgi:hypothetical protein|nr:T9SS type A sorting domain-containing protein [Bacteroidia bacterium]
MKKQLLILSLAALSLMGIGQTARMSLYEEFTGENCGPCAATNPGLNTLLLANLNNMIPIKWQVDIPSAPTTTWSLFQTDKTEIQWRAYTYGYAVSSAPSGRIDGQSQVVFGAASDHPGYMTQGIINTAAAVTSPFSISMLRSWDPTFTTMTATVSITAAQNYTSTGALVFRTVMVEKAIHFATPPGTNGEKDFYYAARKSYPTIQSGTSLPTSWITGQNQTFTIACVAPSYIVTKAEVELVGFIQDDGNRKVQQAAITRAPNDAQANGLVSSFLSCSTPIIPAVSVSNAGINTITTMTILPVVDGVAGTPYAWSGSIVSGASLTINMPALTPTVGNHTYSTNITAVNGGPDDYPANNSNLGSFALTNTIIPAPIVQPFTAVAFPPANWYKNNQDNGIYSFSRIPTVGAYAVAPLGSVKYDSWNNPVVGDRDELYMPTSSFTGLTNMKLTFDVAYAQVDPTVNDGLDVMVSTNCGVTWTNVYSKYGGVLASAPITTVSFYPSGTQWRSEVVNLGVYDNLPQVLVKFVTYNDYGNSMWLDNINLVSSTDIKSVATAFNGIELFPNPAQNEATVRITSSKGGESTVTILNALGQLMLQQIATIDIGNNVVNFDTKNLASGVYYVVIADKEGKSTTKKLIINK